MTPSTGRPSRLAAIWFADIVGYSRLASSEEDTAIRLVDLLRAVLDLTLRDHSGRLVKTTGDGALAEFASASAAVRSALDLERRFAERAEAVVPGARLRVGVHVGEVVPQEDGDLLGDGVNTAARLQQSAAPGQVVISEDVWRSLRQRSEYRFTPLGERALKGLGAPVQIFLAGGVDAPSPRRPAIDALRGLGLRRGALYATAAALVAIGVFALFARRGDGWNGDPATVAAGRPDPTLVGPSLAVLPFANLSPDPENEYFVAGMTEELIGTIGRLQELKVVGGTSSSLFESPDVDIRAAGEELRADAVLTGSVRESGGRVRVTVQLVDVNSGYQIWSETYDRERSDVFAVQEDIARAVAGALDLRIPRGLKAFRIRDRAPDAEAYDLYLRGRHEWRRRTREGLELAVEDFRGAIARDSSFAAAYAGLADTYIQMKSHRYRSGPEIVVRAREAIGRALELDPRLAEAYATRGILRARAEHRVDAALADFRRSIELNPSYPSARHWYAMSLTELGRFDEALLEFSRAVELDPLAPSLHGAYAEALWLSGDLVRAEEMARRANALAPDLFGPLAVLSKILGAQDRGDEALQAAEQAVTLAPRNPHALAHLAHAHARFGERRRAREIVARLEAESDPCAACVADVYVALGDHDRALRWLDPGDWDNLGGYYFPKVDPLYEPLRADARFTRFLGDAGLE